MAKGLGCWSGSDAGVLRLLRTAGRVGVVAFGCVSGTWALDYTYALYSSAEYSDNIRQSNEDTDTPAGRVLRGGLDFAVRTAENATLAAEVLGDLSRIRYSEGSLENENRRSLDAAVMFQPSSSNFRLAVIDSFQQVAEDRRSVRTVNNLRDVNIFSAVPSYFINVTPVSRLRASYGYSRIDEELELTSRDVDTASVGYEYSVSNLSDWSLNVSRSEIEFTENGREYRQQSAFFRWTYTGLLTNWNLDLGRQRVEEGADTDEPLVSFSLERQVNRVARAGLFFQQGYSDAVDTRISGHLLDMVPNIDAVFADDLAREKQVNLYYEMNRGNLRTRVAAELRRLQSEESLSIGREIDEDRYTLNLGINYRFRNERYDLSAFGIGFLYRYVDEQFNLLDEKNAVNEISVRTNYFATRSTTFFAELRSRDTAGTSTASNTDEQAIVIGVRFSPRGG